MARRRFFVPEVRRGTAELTGPDADHLVRVLRVEAGDRYEISDNQRVYLAEVDTARKSVVTFRIVEDLPAAPVLLEITLFVALFKFDHLEWLIEKATELGVTTIVPFEAIRSERGLFQAAAKRLARWQRIALEASQQSRRDHLPVVEGAQPFREVVPFAVSLRLLLDEKPDATPILQCLPRERSGQDHVALLLGPEGGWTDAEREQLEAAGWLPCSLGPTVLRAETAGIAALGVLSAWAGQG